MAPHNTNTAAADGNDSTGLTAKELKMIVTIFKTTETPIKVDTQALADECGYATKASANTAWHALRKKLGIPLANLASTKKEAASDEQEANTNKEATGADATDKSASVMPAASRKGRKPAAIPKAPKGAKGRKATARVKKQENFSDSEEDVPRRLNMRKKRTHETALKDKAKDDDEPVQKRARISSPKPATPAVMYAVADDGVTIEDVIPSIENDDNDQNGAEDEQADAAEEAATEIMIKVEEDDGAAMEHIDTVNAEDAAKIKTEEFVAAADHEIKDEDGAKDEQDLDKPAVATGEEANVEDEEEEEQEEVRIELVEEEEEDDYDEEWIITEFIHGYTFDDESLFGEED